MLKTLNEAVGLNLSDGLFLHADWPAPPNVKTLISTRNGGVSQAPYASLNLGAHVGDAPEHVAHNRALVQAAVPVPLAWLDQVHSATVVPAASALSKPPQADASFDCGGTAACAVMTADCLPVLFCTADGRCTVIERDTFFSYRRDGQTGRMVSAVWLEQAV